MYFVTRYIEIDPPWRVTQSYNPLSKRTPIVSKADKMFSFITWCVFGRFLQAQSVFQVWRESINSSIVLSI